MRLQAPKLATALAILRGIQLASTLLVVALCAALIHQVNTNFDPGYTSLYWGLVLAFALLGMIFAVLGQVSQMYPEKKALRISVIVADVILGLIFVLAGGVRASPLRGFDCILTSCRVRLGYTKDATPDISPPSAAPQMRLLHSY